jgi:hypothetical protein
VEDAFETLSGSSIGKHAPGQFIASQPAIRPNDSRAERFPDLRQSWLARLNHLTRQVVGIHDCRAARAEQLSGRGLAHADATG